MTYQLIEDYSCVWRDGVTPLDPQGFAIHWWGDPTQNPQFIPIVQLLVNRAAAASASVTFVAESGRVACLTSPFEVAWAQGDGGNGWGNRNLVSIECNPRCTAEDRETVAELIADQHIKNGIPINLYPHNKFTTTSCPGVWEQWIPWLTDRANQIVNEKTNGVISGNMEDEMAVLDERVAQVGGGEVTLREVIAEFRAHQMQTRQVVTENAAKVIAAVAAAAAHDGNSLEEITKAVENAIKDNVLSVDVTLANKAAS